MAAERPWPGIGARAGGRLAVLLGVAAGVVACGPPPALEVGRVTFADADLQALDATQREVLVDVAAFGLAVADRRLSEVVGPFVRRDLRSLLLQRAALEIGAEDAGIDDEALRQAYERDPEPELVVRHLVVLSERWRPEEARAAARERAADALARIRGGADFARIVAEYSEEPDAADRGGLLQPGREGSWVPEFWNAARSLSTGETSEVVETEYGFHVIRLEERRVVPFEEARDRALERQMTLQDALARSARWIEVRARGAVVDTPAIRAWRRGEDPGRPLVEWPGHDLTPYRAADLADYMLTLPPDHLAALDDDAIDPVVGTVKSAARSHVLLQHARAVGIESTAAQRIAIEQLWHDRVSGWSQALGFASGQPAREIRARTLEAVTTHRQDVLLAREEILRLRPVLRQLYDVRRSSPAVNRQTTG